MGKGAEIRNKHIFRCFVLPISIAVILSAIISWTNADLEIARLFSDS